MAKDNLGRIPLMLSAPGNLLSLLTAMGRDWMKAQLEAVGMHKDRKEVMKVLSLIWADEAATAALNDFVRDVPGLLSTSLKFLLGSRGLISFEPRKECLLSEVKREANTPVNMWGASGYVCACVR